MSNTIVTEVEAVESELKAEAAKIEQVAIADFKALVSRVEALETRAKGFIARVKALFKL